MSMPSMKRYAPPLAARSVRKASADPGMPSAFAKYSQPPGGVASRSRTMIGARAATRSA
jgi:hypothetical protein